MNQNEPHPIPPRRRTFFATIAWIVAALVTVGTLVESSRAAMADDSNRIQPYPKNPFYWQYTAEESRLPVAINYGAAEKPTAHKFFHTVPALENNEVVLRYQRAFVDKLLSYARKYD